ncbi:Lead, cadmium, zinc and mercury transporting ATPase; Copper-translocating P-type ATPase [Helicobacter heilmannii]|uniref:heavy metal translocating P-type ATPase n=1 Tax=Helicobacter heilmannii TaxID=35817 RepID=UPI0006A05E28|nr:heavy metal translocating P-type ATPase [Helicobacter heilmannii]CRF47540.1 Lead, cadmium, zinc and mercury transporting ATPase; Copper-translocating P-type ATPase [Helicobacter heilmannii]
MTKAQFYIEGMTCSACSSGIERSLGRKAYVKEVGVDLLSKKAFVVYDESQASLEDIFKQIGKLGYSAQKKPLKDLLEPSFLTPNLKLLFTLLSALVVLCLSMFAPLLPLPALLKEPFNNGSAQLIFTLIAMHMGRNFYIHGFKALWARQPNMDSLIALGTSAAFMYSLVLLLRAYNHTLIDGYYFESVCVILLFVMGGKRVEQSSKDKALQAMQELMQEHNSTALKVENGQDSEVAIESLQQGDILRVLPGAYVPVDGVLIQGASEIDESMLSGESVPVFKKEGAKVFAGTLNTHSAFLMQATHNKAQSTLAQIMDLIAKAQGSKAPIARLADKVAGVFVPAVIAIASLAFIVWVFKAGFKEALEVFIAVLVISCPCALGLATPMALLVAQKEAGLLGLFFKDAKSLERAKDISHVLLDKTGTITLGKPVVKEVRPAGGVALLDLLGLCASLEAQSEHVIAKSLVKYAKEQGALLQEVQGVKASAGLGVSGLVGGQEYRAGNLEFFSEGNHLGEFEGIGVFVGTPGKILGLIVLEDQLKEGAKEAIEGMHSYGLKTLLLSGDREASVAKIAAELQMEYKAGAKPQDKLATLEDLQKSGAVVMMVGDGLNDAPALAKSDVGVVMGLGSGASLEVADILSLNNHPSAALQAIKLSKLTITNIKQNLFWAFCYNALAIPLACGIAYPFMLNPMLASLAMSLSSLSVVFNAQRLRGVHKKIKG